MSDQKQQRKILATLINLVRESVSGLTVLYRVNSFSNFLFCLNGRLLKKTSQQWALGCQLAKNKASSFRYCLYELISMA